MQDGADPSRPSDPGPGAPSAAALANRDRYLGMLPRGAPDAPVAADRGAHPVLGAPASISRSARPAPHLRDVRAYLRHSCDLAMSGGTGPALAYPAAACALASHYVFRRIAGSSAAAVPAALTAAAELGRTVQERPRAATPPGFAGLAQVSDWLAGGDRRPARMLPPGPASRPLFRLAVALARAGELPRALAGGRVLVAAHGVPAGRAAYAAGGVWVVAVALWAALVVALDRAGDAGAVGGWVAPVAAVALAVPALAGACAGVLLVAAVVVLRDLRSAAADRGFGLVDGVADRGTGSPLPRDRGPDRLLDRLLDRLAGVPGSGREQPPPLLDWVSERIDDLAGVDAGDERPALTFGDLWLGSVRERSTADGVRLRRASGDAELRVVDLVLVASDLSEGRRVALPPASADRGERAGAPRLLFCDECLDRVLPHRVVVQMVKVAPSTDTDHRCPRHARSGTGVLREMPDPWDQPVVLGVRMSCAVPGVMSAVPLYSVVPGVAGPEVRTHWFADGGVTAGVQTDHFDAVLPRWPTFGLSMVPDVPDPGGDPSAAAVVPDQAASPASRPARSPRSAADLVRAVAAASLGWRDAASSARPGYQGRIAWIRRPAAEARAAGLLFDRAAASALARAGFEAGTALRQRFTSSDDDVPGQSRTDRYRWIRLRLALQALRGTSAEMGARMPLFRDLASSYHVPAALSTWFDPPLATAERDPLWAEATTAVTTLRALSAGGPLDIDVDSGAAPVSPRLRLEVGD